MIVFSFRLTNLTNYAKEIIIIHIFYLSLLRVKDGFSCRMNLQGQRCL